MNRKKFNSKVDRLLQRIPPLGKLLTTLFSAQEVLMLEIFRFLDQKFHVNSLIFLDKYLFKGRWGGKIVPLNINLQPDMSFLPSQEILELLSRSSVTGISYCYCRNVQRKHGKPNCDHPINTCIHLGFGKDLKEIPFKSENLKKVSKEEIRKILIESDERGLIHQLIYYPSPDFYYVACNCCPCCCVVLSKFLKMGAPQVIKSDFIAETDLSKCANCGNCVQWCYFGARKMNNGRLALTPSLCFGCGICISKCPNRAISLKKKLKN